MGTVYEINKQLGVTFVVWNGPVTIEHFLAYAELLSSEPDWLSSERRQIADWRDAALDVSIDQAVLQRAAAMFATQKAKLAGLKLAILARDEFDQASAFGRLINRFGATVIVFNTTITACKWLGVDLDKANAVLRRMRHERGLEPG
jgi:hypothetical protein